MEAFAERDDKVIWMNIYWNKERGYLLQIGPLDQPSDLDLAREIESLFVDKGCTIRLPLPHIDDPH